MIANETTLQCLSIFEYGISHTFCSIFGGKIIKTAY